MESTVNENNLIIITEEERMRLNGIHRLIHEEIEEEIEWISNTYYKSENPSDHWEGE